MFVEFNRPGRTFLPFEQARELVRGKGLKNHVVSGCRMKGVWEAWAAHQLGRAGFNSTCGFRGVGFTAMAGLVRTRAPAHDTLQSNRGAWRKQPSHLI